MVQQAPEKRQASRAHVPALPSHSQSVVYLEAQICQPPSIVAFANALSARAMPSSRRLGEAISVEADSSSFCICRAWQHSTRCFLSDSRGTERMKCLPSAGLSV